ncbi:MAG TPA: UvrD-helicase domain-containing protein [Candidatus Paceibacterota bacterium]
MVKLNSRQEEAAETLNGPLLILAGAGAGKTKTLTERVGNLINHGVPADKILAITFTNKAAKEMKERIYARLEKTAPRSFEMYGAFDTPFISTFHSLCVYVLREESAAANISKNFKIFDKGDQKGAIKKAMERLKIDPKEYEPGRIAGIISRMKNDFMSPEETFKKAGSTIQEIAARIYGEYERVLADERALDFDDLLFRAALLFRKHPEVLKKYQDKWLYIHIDEYQDTNEVQYEIAKMLSRKSRNICVVGDIDQNIYSWRGASLKHILRFEKDYPEGKLVVLEENYRSTKRILETANAVISKNVMRKEKNLFTRNPSGEKIGFLAAYDENTEAMFVAESCLELLQGGAPAEEIAVLYRANFQSRPLEEMFLHLSIPYELVGTKFFEREEVKHAVAYLRLLTDDSSSSDMARVANVPARGLGKVSILKILSGKENELSLSAKKSWQEFKKIVENGKIFLEKHTPKETLEHILNSSGLANYYEERAREGSEEDEEKFYNIRELVNLSSRFDDIGIDALTIFLSEVALQTGEESPEKRGVRLMTVHAAKGLEFSHVFIVGLEEGLFPHEKISEENQTPEEKEEERRLFYVALTRAKKKLVLSWAQSRLVFGSHEVNVPSSFLLDIPEEHVESVDSKYGGRKSLLNIEF